MCSLFCQRMRCCHDSYKDVSALEGDCASKFAINKYFKQVNKKQASIIFLQTITLK